MNKKSYIIVKSIKISEELESKIKRSMAKSKETFGQWVRGAACARLAKEENMGWTRRERCPQCGTVWMQWDDEPTECPNCDYYENDEWEDVAPEEGDKHAVL